MITKQIATWMTNSFSSSYQQVEKHIKKNGSEFMASKHLGFILTCPSNLGTGVRCSVHVKIPKLAAIDKEAKLKEICKKLRLQERGTCKSKERVDRWLPAADPGLFGWGRKGGEAAGGYSSRTV